jgi:hypothetical protein
MMGKKKINNIPVTAVETWGKDQESRTEQCDRWEQTSRQYEPEPGYTKVGCCHEGVETVFVIPGTETKLVAASKGYAREASYLCDMVIDCGAHITSGTIKPFVSAVGLVTAETKASILQLNSLVSYVPPVVLLDWPDQGIPSGGLAFWKGLIGILPNPGTVLVCCVGGHGRTGTALASMRIVTAIDGVSAAQAIAEIRQWHCKHAVESISQERYLQALATRAQALRDTIQPTYQQ